MTIHFVLEKFWESRFPDGSYVPPDPVAGTPASHDSFVGPTKDASVGCEAKTGDGPDREAWPISMADVVAGLVDDANAATGATKALELVANDNAAFDPMVNAIVARDVRPVMEHPIGKFVAAGWFKQASDEVQNLGVNLIFVRQEGAKFVEYACFFLMVLNDFNPAAHRQIRLRVPNTDAGAPKPFKDVDVYQVPAEELLNWHFFEIEGTYVAGAAPTQTITRLRIDDSPNLADDVTMPSIEKGDDWADEVFQVYLETTNEYRCFKNGSPPGKRGVVNWSSIAAYHVREELDFGVVPQCGTGTLEVQIACTGPADTRIDALSIADADAFAFALDDSGLAPYPVTLAPGEVVSVDVRFVPREERAFRATLVLDNDDAHAPQTDIALIGACAGREAGCYAPIMHPIRPGCVAAIVCPILAAAYVVAILGLAFAAAFGSRTARCQIRQLTFRIGHCFSGNDDPCRRL